MTIKSLFVKQGRLRPTWRVVCYVFAYLVGSVVVQIPVAVVLVIMLQLGTVDESTLTVLEYSLPLLVILGIANLVLVLPLTYVFRRFLDGGTLLDLGFHRRTGWLRQVFGGLLLGVLLIGLTFVVQWGAGWLQVSGFAWQVQSPAVVLGRLLGYLVVMAMIAVYEELTYRGYILQNLHAEWGTIVALIASSVLFGIFHGLNPNVTLLALVNISLAGILLAACYLVTRELWLPMAFHFSWNFLQGPVLSLPVSGLPTGGLLLTETGGNALLTGGAFGPEGGLLSTATMSLGLLILWLWRRRQTPDRILPGNQIRKSGREL